MRTNSKDRGKHKINRGQVDLEESLDKNDLEGDSGEVEGILEDSNEQVTKTFKHLGKAVEIKF